MIELRVGFMKNKELAEWRGVLSKTWSSNIQKYLDELKDFCDYERVYGGVIISWVRYPQYQKGLLDKQLDQKIYQEYIDNNCNNGITSISGMTNYLLGKTDYYSGLEDSCVMNRLKAAGETLYGNTRENTIRIKDYEEPVSGLRGYKYYLWAVKLDNNGHYREMNIKEREIFCNLCKGEGYKMYKELVVERYNKKGIKEEKIDQYIVDDYKGNFCNKVLFMFKDITGNTLARASMHIDEKGQQVWADSDE